MRNVSVQRVHRGDVQNGSKWRSREKSAPRWTMIEKWAPWVSKAIKNQSQRGPTSTITPKIAPWGIPWGVQVGHAKWAPEESKNRSKLVKMGEHHWTFALLVAQITLTIDFGRSKVDFNRFWSDLGATLDSFCSKIYKNPTRFARRNARSD